MTKKKKTIIITSSLLGAILVPSVVIGSLLIVNKKESEKYFNDELDNVNYMDFDKLVNNLYFPKLSRWNYNLKLRNAYSWNWYKNLSSKKWNKHETKFYCESETQALVLYLRENGDFWNVDLHKNKEPTNKKLLMQKLYPGRTVEIRGSDYKYISKALSKNSLKENTVVYHGVEFMEDEFYEQLEPFITYNQTLNKYNYEKCVGQKIKSYGFLSTTLNKKVATEYTSGFNWTNNTYNLPLKEKFAFKIYVPKLISDVSYVSELNFSGWSNREEQILFNRNSKFEIKKFYKENGLNFFDLLYLGVEN